MKWSACMRAAASGSLLLIPILTCGLATTAVAGDPDPDRYLVSFLDAGKGKAALKAAGARIELDLASHEAAAVHIPPRALKGLRNNPHIEYIEEDALRYPMAETVPYGITMVQADQLIYQGGIKLCIIDSGYYRDHEDLQYAGVSGKIDSGSGSPFTDGCGHGTHVAGTIAALANNGKGVVGVNSTGDIGLHIVKVFGDATEGNCGWTYSSSLVAALDECLSQASDIVSMSLGGTFKSRTEDRAFAQAFKQGVLSVAAAGNDGNSRMSYPASYASVMSVAAIDSAKVVAGFSQQNDQVEIAAPGVGVLSTLPVDVTAEITVGNTIYAGDGIENAAQGSVTGTVVDGGLCNSVGSWSGSVVMCARGNISFYDKVMNVQSGHGVAAVIYNNVSGGFSGTLGAGNSSSIPAISLSQEDGLAIINGGSLGQSGAVENTAVFPGDGYAAWDGTSMATPHVSGVAALVWSHHQECTNAQIRNALNMTAEDRGAAGRDTAYGYGLVQAAQASAFLDLSCDGPAGGGGGGGGTDPPPPSCGQPGNTCDVDSDCCSGTCKGKPGSRTCK